MVTVYKDNVVRQIKDAQLDAYLSAGWTDKQSQPKGKKVLVDEPVVLQPTIDANPIVTSNIGDANNESEEI